MNRKTTIQFYQELGQQREMPSQYKIAQVLEEQTVILRKILKMMSQPMALEEKYLTVGQVAKILKVSGSTVRRYIAQGKLEAIKRNNGGPRDKYLITQEAIARMLKGE